MDIHVSDMRAFSDCRLRWHFSSHMRLGRAAINPNRSLALGTLCHRAFELWYESHRMRLAQDCTNQAILELEAPIEMHADAHGIVNNYCTWATMHDDFEPITQEQAFQVPLWGDYKFAGRWDMVVERLGKIWLNDFKITGAPFQPYGDYLANQDEQARAYSWAGRRIYGDEFGGIMFTLVRNKAPELPQKLLRGGISRNKQQKTTWDLYRKAVLEEGENPADYDDMREHLQANVQFIHRVFVNLGKRPLEAFEHRAIETTKLMTAPDLFIYPNASVMTCRMCSFNFPCSVWHSVGEKAAKKILFSEYQASRYAENAADEDKPGVLSDDGSNYA